MLLDSNHETCNLLQRYSKATSNLRDSSAGKIAIRYIMFYRFLICFCLVFIKYIKAIDFKLMSSILQSELEGLLSAIA